MFRNQWSLPVALCPAVIRKGLVQLPWPDEGIIAEGSCLSGVETWVIPSGKPLKPEEVLAADVGI